MRPKALPGLLMAVAIAGLPLAAAAQAPLAAEGCLGCHGPDGRGVRRRRRHRRAGSRGPGRDHARLPRQ